MESTRQHAMTVLSTVLTEKFEVPADRIDDDATLADLELDSLAVVELLVTLQEELGVPLDDSEASGETTVGEVSRAVVRLLGADEDRDGSPGSGTAPGPGAAAPPEVVE
ncbi:acyl carrier protein [Streptomyces durbertensis]|uniref:Acyl carrier protein n=1 Tax=Streptomyces durbertensis TaxID=2448886 RepID=A0ABR6EGQ5_9ACTN|nr:acyl carrier protein [Streptomyces durbertensis]MBB1243674.1 acyl carrier protein [Streptomyces durbertensis]